MSVINITEPNHDQNGHHIKLVIVYQISGPLVKWFKSWENVIFRSKQNILHDIK